MAESVVVYDMNKAAAELCRRKLSFFVKEFWSTIIAEELVWSDHMQYLCDEIQIVYERLFLRPDPNDPEPNPDKKRKIRLPKLYDLIINIPPGTSKSTIVTIMAPAWAWTRDPSLRVITGSYSNDLSVGHAEKSRDIIDSDKYKIYFPEVVPNPTKWTKSDYENTRHGQRYATSVGGTVTGVHAHVLSWDDLLNPKLAASAAECKTTNNWLDKTASTRKIDKLVTVTILVMQRLSVNDPTGYLLGKKKDNVKHICLPAELSKNVKPEEAKGIYKNGLLDPVRLGSVALAESRKDLGADGYAGQMGQMPVPDGGLIWKKEWFIPVPDHLMPDIRKARDVSNDWDLAYTKEEVNAASAFIKSGIYANNIYIFDFDFQWHEFPELIKWMKSVGHPHYIEAKAAGKSAKQSLKKMGIVAIEVNVQGGNDKVARAKLATPTAEAGFIYIRESLVDKFLNDERQGILFFPKGPFKDVADCLSQMLHRRSKGGRITVGDNGTVDTTNQTGSEAKENPLDWLEE